MVPNSNVIEGYASVNNFDPVITDRYDKFLKTISPFLVSQSYDFYAFWGLQKVVSDDKAVNDGYKVEQDGQFQLRWFPCVLSTENFHGSLEAFNNILLSAEYEYTLVIEGTKMETNNCVNGPANFLITDYKSSQIYSYFEVDTSADGWLMQLSANYPGWKARLDGEQVTVYYADVMYRAIYLPAGDHTIEFYYESETILWGIGISLLSILITIIVVYLNYYKPIIKQ